MKRSIGLLCAAVFLVNLGGCKSQMATTDTRSVMDTASSDNAAVESDQARPF